MGIGIALAVAGTATVIAAIILTQGTAAILAGIAVGCGLAAAGVAQAQRAAGAVSGWGTRIAPAPSLAARDASLRARHASGQPITNAGYDDLVGYFAAGVAAYRSPGAALVTYPGLPGTRGLRVEGLEGFARSGTLLAAWASTRGDTIPLPDGTRFDAFAHLAAGLTAGTDPAHTEYWGEAVDLDQRIVEAGDIAVIVLTLRDRLPAALSPAARGALASWLLGAAEREVYGGNWHLFPLLACHAASALGQPAPDAMLAGHRRQILGFALPDGWFNENHAGRVDLYTPWQMHYALAVFRTMVTGEEELARLAETSLRDFARPYLHFFSPHGFPLFGRSLPYRFSVPTPLTLAAALPDTPVSPGAARRALDATWSHYIVRGGLAAGGVTQGPAGGDDPALLENYCGRASALWSLRSLVVAYWFPAGHPVWTAAPEPLPVERGNYAFTLAGPNLAVSGDAATGRVTVRHLPNAGMGYPAVTPHALWRQVLETVLRRPFRPANYGAKYMREAYVSDDPPHSR
jgi:hypothetical protein